MGPPCPDVYHRGILARSAPYVRYRPIVAESARRPRPLSRTVSLTETGLYGRESAGRLLLRNFALPLAGECAALVVAPSSRASALHPAHRPELHDFDGGLRDLEMRVAFECLRGRFVRLGLHDGG